MRQRRLRQWEMRHARSLWWLSVALVAACGDDDDAVPVRPLDGGVADAGVDARPPLEIDPAPNPQPSPYWHIERPPDSQRSWLVSPDGARTFVLGVDSVFREDECAGMPAYTHRAPDAATTEWKRLRDDWHFNAVGAFGNLDVAGAPYSLVVSTEPRGDDRALRDATGNVLVNGLSGAKVGDPYNPAFAKDFQATLQETVAPRYKDERLQIIYLGHETGMFDIASSTNGGIRDFRPWIWSNCPATSMLQKPQCAPHALLQSLATTYADIAALNLAWGTSYASFEAINKPPPVCNATCGSDLLHFVHDGLLPTWVNLVVGNARAFAPKHVIASPRLALGTPATFHFFAPSDTWTDDGQSIGSYDPYPLLSKFDLVALDVHTASPTYEEPWFGDGIHKLQADSQLPAIVSEMGTQVGIPGWSNQGRSLGPTFVADQATRGDRYASQVSQLAAYPDIVGAVWHAWSDRFVLGDPGRQLEMGLVQCEDAAHGFMAGTAWTELVSRVSAPNLATQKLE
jgi:hypothetical protein